MTEKENKKERHFVLEILLFLLFVSLVANMALWARADSKSIIYEHRIDSLLNIGRDLRKELRFTIKDNHRYRQASSLLDSLLFQARCEIQNHGRTQNFTDLKHFKIISFEKRVAGKNWLEGNHAGKVAKLEICFTTPNRKTFDNKNIFSLRIIDPRGNPIAGKNKMSRWNPQKKSSSFAGIESFILNPTENFCLSYEMEETVLHAGIYAVEIYSEDSLLKTLHHQLR